MASLGREAVEAGGDLLAVENIPQQRRYSGAIYDFRYENGVEEALVYA
jgi:hypothetical protein